jgi:hypothetical protein
MHSLTDVPELVQQNQPPDSRPNFSIVLLSHSIHCIVYKGECTSTSLLVEGHLTIDHLDPKEDV